MKILPINTNYTSRTFKGYIVEDDINGLTHKSAAIQTGKRIENTIEKFRTKPSGKIYYADPLEVVSDNIREIVDFVVYDDEPKFPDINNDISKLYFYNPKRDYYDEIDKFRQYFYRLEMSESKTVADYRKQYWSNNRSEAMREKIDYHNAHVADAKYNQETAATCLNIMDEAKETIRCRNLLGIGLSELKNKLHYRELDLIEGPKELERRHKLNDILTSKIKHLETMKSEYTKLSDSLKNEINKYTNNIDDINQSIKINKDNYGSQEKFLNEPENIKSYQQTLMLLSNTKAKETTEIKYLSKKISEIKNEISKYTLEQASNTGYITKLETYMKNLPAIIDNLKNSITSKSFEFEQANKALIPHFDKLKNYFYSRGIKHIK